MPKSDEVILEKGGHKLLEDRFISRKKEEYFIKDMKSASLFEKRSFGGLVGGYYLSIEFCNGTRKDFWFRHRLPLKLLYGAYFTPSFKPVNSKIVSAMEREVSVIILEWAEKINSLINAHNPQH